jgi:HSP20 family protein
MNTSTLSKTENQTVANRGNGSNRVSHLTPLANILETQDGYILEAEMPGVNKEGLEITVENGELVLFGRRHADEVKGTELYRESRGWDYRRVFELDPSIDTARITAKMEQGVLTLHLPKAESVKPRKITVTD